jgi:hypothetical protein
LNGAEWKKCKAVDKGCQEKPGRLPLESPVFPDRFTNPWQSSIFSTLHPFNGPKFSNGKKDVWKL